MKKLKSRDGSDYRVFGMFLKRRNIENSYSLATLLIEKFVYSKKSSCYLITSEDLKEKKIIPSTKHNTFAHWREEMIKKGILICMADKKELKEKTPNHKANLFKPGSKIKKHLDKISLKCLPEQFSLLSQQVEGMEQKIGCVEQKIDKVEQRIDHFDDRLEKMVSLLIKACPPDSEVRRQIIRENFMDNEKCLELLTDETKKWINFYEDVGEINDEDKN